MPNALEMIGPVPQGRMYLTAFSSLTKSFIVDPTQVVVQINSNCPANSSNHHIED